MMICTSSSVPRDLSPLGVYIVWLHVRGPLKAIFGQIVFCSLLVVIVFVWQVMNIFVCPVCGAERSHAVFPTSVV